MGNVDRLLNALARKLSRTADEKVITAALRAAVQALPESQAKTRDRVCRTEQECVQRLKAELEGAERTAIIAEASEEASAHAADEDSTDLYAGLHAGDPGACINRCAQLLTDALFELRPEHLAQNAVEGLLAALSREDAEHIEASSLSSCMRLVPKILAAFGGKELPAWRRFLGFLVSSAALLPDKPESQALTEQLGGLIVLSASPAAVRAALCLSLVKARMLPGSSTLQRMAAVVLPAVRAGFGGAAALDREDVKRGDLLALLHGLRVVCLCQHDLASAATSGRAHSAFALVEARSLLRAALEQHFDAALLQQPLERLAAASVSRDLKGAKRKAGDGPAVAAAIVVESFDAAAANITSAVIARLVDCHGLPAGKEEEQDRGVVAQAAGELFFEDVVGELAGPPPEKGDDEATGAAADVAAGAFERLEGVEALRRRRRSSLKLKLNQVRQDVLQHGGKGRGKGKGKGRRRGKGQRQGVGRGRGKGHQAVSESDSKGKKPRRKQKQDAGEKRQASSEGNGPNRKQRRFFQ